MLRLHDLVYDFQPSEADAVCQRWLAHAADDPTLGYTRADLAGSVYGAYTCQRPGGRACGALINPKE